MFDRKKTPGVRLLPCKSSQQQFPDRTRIGVIWFVTGLSMAGWALALAILHPMETPMAAVTFIMMMLVLLMVAVVATFQPASTRV